jgi:tetratricopeptide (TPR) repeat protein
MCLAGHALLGLPATAAAAPASVAPAASSLCVETIAGELLCGTVERQGSDGLRVDWRDGAGWVTRILPAAAIRAVRFSDWECLRRLQEAFETGDQAAKLDELRGLYARWSAYARWLPAEVAAVLARLPQAELDAGRPLPALVMATHLLDAWPEDAQRQRALMELRLLALWQLGQYAALETLLAAWEVLPAAAESALGHWLRGELALTAGNPADAIARILQAITILPGTCPPYLPACYAVAVRAARLIEDAAWAAQLELEWKERCHD